MPTYFITLFYTLYHFLMNKNTIFCKFINSFKFIILSYLVMLWLEFEKKKKTTRAWTQTWKMLPGLFLQLFRDAFKTLTRREVYSSDGWMLAVTPTEAVGIVYSAVYVVRIKSYYLTCSWFLPRVNTGNAELDLLYRCSIAIVKLCKHFEWTCVVRQD